jgi:hypothetical protein
MKINTLKRATTPALALIAWLLLPQTGHCFYNPSTGRWLSRDLIEEQGGLNLFTFCRNNPFSYVDATGLQAFIGIPEILDPIIENPILNPIRPIRPITWWPKPAPVSKPTLPGGTMPPLHPPLPVVPPQVPTTPNPGTPTAPNPSAPQPSGPLPPNQGGPPYPYGPDGDCTPSEKDALQKEMKAICNQPRKCTPACFMSDGELIRRLEINRNCYDKRKNIMDKCYRGGDDTGHPAQLDQINNAIRKCEDELRARGIVSS